MTDEDWTPDLVWEMCKAHGIRAGEGKNLNQVYEEILKASGFPGWKGTHFKGDIVAIDVQVGFLLTQEEFEQRKRDDMLDNVRYDLARVEVEDEIPGEDKPEPLKPGEPGDWEH